MIIPASYIRDFCREFDYPAEAEEALCSAYLALSEDPVFSADFDRRIRAYQDDLTIIEDPLPPSSAAHPYTADLLLFICCTPRLKAEYEKRGLPLPVYHDSMLDLKWKLFECRKMHGVWGSFVARWFAGFFKVRRFALGRFQYDLDCFCHRYESEEFTVPFGTPCLGVHIPNCGSIAPEIRRASYETAYRFIEKYYPSYLTDGKLFFRCASWLLYPPMRGMLPEGSNILSFMDDWTVYGSFDDPTHHDFWRIFYHRPDEDDSVLPQETSLQRAYLKRVRAGLPGGEGLGIFSMNENHQILKGKDGIYYE